MRIVSSRVGTFVALRSAFSAISSQQVKRSFKLQVPQRGHGFGLAKEFVRQLDGRFHVAHIPVNMGAVKTPDDLRNAGVGRCQSALGRGRFRQASVRWSNSISPYHRRSPRI
ncbi:MAG: hypothetical protein U1F77_15220 [Kiritimatiellia bacterium]